MFCFHKHWESTPAETCLYFSSTSMTCGGYILVSPAFLLSQGREEWHRVTHHTPALPAQPKQIPVTPEMGIFSIAMLGEINQCLCAEAWKYTVRTWKALLPGTVVTFDAASWHFDFSSPGQ